MPRISKVCEIENEIVDTIQTLTNMPNLDFLLDVHTANRRSLLTERTAANLFAVEIIIQTIIIGLPMEMDVVKNFISVMLIVIRLMIESWLH